VREYVVVKVPAELLPQVTRELLSFTFKPDLVQVVHGDVGQEIHVHPEVAEAWFQFRNPPEPAPAPAPEPVPPALVTEKPPAPAAPSSKKQGKTTSAYTPGEESAA
jgi:hypothetical protein